MLVEAVVGQQREGGLAPERCNHILERISAPTQQALLLLLRCGRFVSADQPPTDPKLTGD